MSLVEEGMQKKMVCSQADTRLVMCTKPVIVIKMTFSKKCWTRAFWALVIVAVSCFVECRAPERDRRDKTGRIRAEWNALLLRPVWTGIKVWQKRTCHTFYAITFCIVAYTVVYNKTKVVSNNENEETIEATQIKIFEVKEKPAFYIPCTRKLSKEREFYESEPSYSCETSFCSRLDGELISSAIENLVSGARKDRKIRNAWTKRTYITLGSFWNTRVHNM